MKGVIFLELKENKKETIKIFAANLNEMMKLKCKSRKDVCDDLDIKYTTFCDWINGRTYPRVEAIELLADYFGISVGDFFIESDMESTYSKDRYEAYARRIGAFDMDTINKLTNEQIKELILAGISFKHKTLEEYIDERGEGVLIPSDELSWGKPVGDEIW